MAFKMKEQKLHLRIMLPWRRFALLTLSGWRQRWLTAHANRTSQAPKGLLSRDASNHIERSRRPQVLQPHNPTLICADVMTDLSWEFLQTPNSCHTYTAWAKNASSMCVYAYDCEAASVRADSRSVSLCVRSQSADVRVSGDGKHILASYTCGSLSKFSAWRVKPQHLSQRCIKSPRAAYSVSGRPSQKCPMSSARCVSHLLSPLHASPLLLHTLSDTLPLFF